MSVMAAKCATCPFRDDTEDIWGKHGGETRARIQRQSFDRATQTCHHSGGVGNPDTHICRGARDFQLQIFFRMGILEAPTDAAWNKKRQEMRI